MTHLWLESSVTKVQNVQGAGHSLFDKNTFFARICKTMSTNGHKMFATLPLLLPKIAMCIQLQNLELVQLYFTIWPQQWWYIAATMEERALCIYGFRVVLRFCRQLFSSVKYFCGFLQLFTSFQYFIFIVQISFTNENLYISAGTKEEIVRTKVENKLQ